MVSSKKHCFFRLLSFIGCLFLIVSSAPLRCVHADSQDSSRFCIVLDPFSHCLEKVPLEDIFSVLDLHILASEAALNSDELHADPEVEEDSTLPWSSSMNIWTLEIQSNLSGISLPDSSDQSWLDHLIQNAEKYKSTEDN